jgi:hypothetical protein
MVSTRCLCWTALLQTAVYCQPHHKIWYQLDVRAELPCYRLQSTASHITTAVHGPNYRTSISNHDKLTKTLLYDVKTNNKYCYMCYTVIVIPSNPNSIPQVHSWKMSHKSDTEFPFTTVYLLGVKRLTASSYIMYDCTTSGHMDL